MSIEIRLTPFTNDQQSCYQQSIFVEPNASLFSYEDYFGNRVHAFSVNEPHKKLTIRNANDYRNERGKQKDIVGTSRDGTE